MAKAKEKVSDQDSLRRSQKQKQHAAARAAAKNKVSTTGFSFKDLKQAQREDAQRLREAVTFGPCRECPD